MLRRFLSWVRARRSDEAAAGDEKSAESRFVPSRLDDSVRYAHGGSGAEIDREMGRIETEAELLEERDAER